MDNLIDGGRTPTSCDMAHVFFLRFRCVSVELYICRPEQGARRSAAACGSEFVLPSHADIFCYRPPTDNLIFGGCIANLCDMAHMSCGMIPMCSCGVVELWMCSLSIVLGGLKP